MKPQKQRVVNKGMGDCFAACMASLLELPLAVIPNDHSDSWLWIWEKFLDQFGLELTASNSKGPIYSQFPWIASVVSKNYENTTHAILMHEGARVLFDPSTKKTYKKGEKLLGEKDVIRGGYIIRVSDFSKLHKLQEYRVRLASEPQ
jgi:hypothetical protein